MKLLYYKISISEVLKLISFKLCVKIDQLIRHPISVDTFLIK